jgi:hypothetical protein
MCLHRFQAPSKKLSGGSSLRSYRSHDSGSSRGSKSERSNSREGSDNGSSSGRLLQTQGNMHLSRVIAQKSEPSLTSRKSSVNIELKVQEEEEEDEDADLAATNRTKIAIASPLLNCLCLECV